MVLRMKKRESNDVGVLFNVEVLIQAAFQKSRVEASWKRHKALIIEGKIYSNEMDVKSTSFERKDASQMRFPRKASFTLKGKNIKACLTLACFCNEGVLSKLSSDACTHR